MPVPVVRIWKVQVEVGQREMDMPVGMGFANRTKLIVGVLMMGAVRMGVFMIHLLVNMVMFVTLGQMQPDAPGHEGRGGQKPEGDLFPEQDNAHQAAHKGRHGKIGPGAGRADAAAP
jgi:hypothetical protein